MKTKKSVITIIATSLLIVFLSFIAFVLIYSNRPFKTKENKSQVSGTFSLEDFVEGSNAEGVQVKYTIKAVNKMFWGEDYISLSLECEDMSLPTFLIDVEFKDKPSANNPNKIVSSYLTGGNIHTNRYDAAWNSVQSMSFKMSCNDKIVFQEDFSLKKR